MRINKIWAEIWAKNPALAHLGLRSSVAEVEKAFHNSGLWNEYHYAKDEHFEFVLRDIDSLKMALGFISELNKDAMKRELNHQKSWKNRNTYIDTIPTCQKTWGIMSWLEDKQWHKPEYIVIPFAIARRTCCSCHELGSFALRKE